MFIKAKLIFNPVNLMRIKNYLLILIFNKNVKKKIPLAIEIFIKLFIFLIYL